MALDPFETGPSLEGRIKESARDLDDGDGAAVQEVLADAVDGTEYTEAGAEDALDKLIRTGECYHPSDGVVRVTP